MNDRYFIAKGKHLVVPVTKQEYEDHWNKKREEQTEEEWLKSLNTNQLAKWITYQIYYATNCDVYSQNRKNWKVNDWEKWLKGNHK